MRVDRFEHASVDPLGDALDARTRMRRLGLDPLADQRLQAPRGSVDRVPFGHDRHGNAWQTDDVNAPARPSPEPLRPSSGPPRSRSTESSSRTITPTSRCSGSSSPARGPGPLAGAGSARGERRRLRRSPLTIARRRDAGPAAATCAPPCRSPSTCAPVPARRTHRPPSPGPRRAGARAGVRRPCVRAGDRTPRALRCRPGLPGRVIDLDSPVVQAPLAGGPSTPELAAAVCQCRRLGFVAAGYLMQRRARRAIRRTRDLTDGAVRRQPVRAPRRTGRRQRARGLRRPVGR